MWRICVFFAGRSRLDVSRRVSSLQVESSLERSPVLHGESLPRTSESSSSSPRVVLRRSSLVAGFQPLRESDLVPPRAGILLSHPDAHLGGGGWDGLSSDRVCVCVECQTEQQQQEKTCAGVEPQRYSAPIHGFSRLDFDGDPIQNRLPPDCSINLIQK